MSIKSYKIIATKCGQTDMSSPIRRSPSGKGTRINEEWLPFPAESPRNSRKRPLHTETGKVETHPCKKILFKKNVEVVEQNEKMLGEGSFAVVTCGELHTPGNPVTKVAIKTDKEEGSSVKYEGHFHNNLQHCPQFLRLIGTATNNKGNKKNESLLITKLAEMGTLKKHLDALEPSHLKKLLPNDKDPQLLYLYILNQILYGLNHLHSQGYIHRDIKPDNIFLAYTQTVKIGDFGQAGPLYQTDKDGQADKYGHVCYRAPELLKKERPDENFKVDIWSVGVCMFEILVGSSYIEKLSETANSPIPISDSGSPNFEELAQQLPGWIDTYHDNMVQQYLNPEEDDPLATIKTLTHRMLTVDPQNRPLSETLIKDISEEIKRRVKDRGELFETMKTIFEKVFIQPYPLTPPSTIEGSKGTIYHISDQGYATTP